ncbi:MAG: histidinol-phosphate transaminase [Gammaproteobacteria bacterium]
MSNPYLAIAAPGVKGLQPYQPGKPISELEREYGVSNIIKLASNENPLGPGAAARAAIEREIAEIARYPDGGGFDLKVALAEYHAVDPACITLGNGSNDVLVLLAEAFLTPETEAVYSEYAFAVYPIAVQATGARARVAPAFPPDHATSPLGHDLDAMAERLNDHTRLVFIANPNNPTGTWVSRNALRRFVESVPEHALVVVDEAYFHYVEEPEYPDTTRWLDDFPNLVVTRTFSKIFGLAGARAGYSLSAPGIADLLNRVRQPFNLNSLAQAAALAALGDEEHIERSRKLNQRGLEEITQACETCGLGYVPSIGNFVLVDFGRPALPVYDALLRESIIVRPVGNYGLPNHLRISVGLPEENERLAVALRKVL